LGLIEQLVDLVGVLERNILNSARKLPVGIAPVSGTVEHDGDVSTGSTISNDSTAALFVDHCEAAE
tara:strand:- start:1391 stop:1588 length:198 start_codon:yes stop_codon:yes gene_type:complete